MTVLVQQPRNKQQHNKPINQLNTLFFMLKIQ
jgi:hypothetical protein